MKWLRTKRANIPTRGGRVGGPPSPGHTLAGARASGAVPYALSPRREAGVVPGFGLTEDGAGVVHFPGLFD